MAWLETSFWATKSTGCLKRLLALASLRSLPHYCHRSTRAKRCLIALIGDLPRSRSNFRQLLVCFNGIFFALVNVWFYLIKPAAFSSAYQLAQDK